MIEKMENEWVNKSKKKIQSTVLNFILPGIRTCDLWRLVASQDARQPTTLEEPTCHIESKLQYLKR